MRQRGDDEQLGNLQRAEGRWFRLGALRWLYFILEGGGGVRGKGFVKIRNRELSESLLRVEITAPDHHGSTLIGWLDYEVSAVSKGF